MPKRSGCMHLLTLTLLLVGFVGASLPARAQSAPPSPTNLRCEYLTNPMGVDVAQPRFSWVVENPARDQAQSAYQVLVASSAALLDQNKGDQWDSGKTASDDFTQIAYAGKALESGKTYFWKARYWDAQGRASAYSSAAKFDMGLLSRADWKGQWIGGANQLRTEFQLPDGVARARAFICGIGYYELRINGKKVGKNVLDPGWTTYDKRVLYSSYDVTPYLMRGANAVGVMLGEGWYHSRALIFQLNIELANGKTVSIASSPEWKGKDGPITSDGVWNGETYDARMETPGWDRAGYDDSGWSPAKKIDGPKGVLSSQMMPPIRVVDTMVPVKMTNPRPGVYVFDMGQNMSGWARLRVRGPRGASVRMRFSELINPDGTINRENIRMAKARDIYTLKGDGEEVYEPRFTYHGFRYVEVTGFPGTPGLDSLRGRVVHSAVEPVGSFAASKQILNDIQKIILWSQVTNLFSIPTDCDQRNEREGWMGDAQATAEEAMMNFDMAAFYTNFIRNIRDAQREDGAVPDTVPHGYGQYPADPAWGTAYPSLCWYMWQHYGDKRILEENYDGLKKYIENLRSMAQDNVLRMSHYGDWVAVESTPMEYTGDFYYYHDVHVLAQVAGILGKSADAAAYSKLAGDIKVAFNKTFFDEKTGNYSNGTQTANAMALFMDFEPEKLRSLVARNLTWDIVYGHNTHVTSGFIGVRYLMPALVKIGRADLAYDLAAQTTYPSWGYMIEHGATTLWELWQEKTGPSMNSHDHIMFGSVGAWFYNALAGINLGEDGAGYKHIRIEPNMVEDLNYASGTVETIRGRVSSRWTRLDSGATIDVDIPLGSDATVLVPMPQELTDITVREGDRVVWENGRYVSGAEGVHGATAGRDGQVTFRVGSGHYEFHVTGD